MHRHLCLANFSQLSCTRISYPGEPNQEHCVQLLDQSRSKVRRQDEREGGIRTGTSTNRKFAGNHFCSAGRQRGAHLVPGSFLHVVRDDLYWPTLKVRGSRPCVAGPTGKDLELAAARLLDNCNLTLQLNPPTPTNARAQQRQGRRIRSSRRSQGPQEPPQSSAQIRRAAINAFAKAQTRWAASNAFALWQLRPGVGWQFSLRPTAGARLARASDRSHISRAGRRAGARGPRATRRGGDVPPPEARPARPAAFLATPPFRDALER